jgi:chromosome segregation ATPase
MNETLITDLVAQEALDQLETLDRKMEGTLQQFKDCALELAKGIKIPVEVNGDLQQLQQLANTTMQRAGQAAQQYTQCLQQQQQVIANTTNTISRQLAEQEKLNKTQRAAFTQNMQALDIAERIVGTYEQNTRQLAQYTAALASNKDQLKEVERQRKAGLITNEQAVQRSGALMAEQNKLKAAMQEVASVVRVQAKEMNAAEGSYVHLSQQLELLKKAQKGLNESEKAGEEGRLLEAEIQNLDARLKDLAADMGEFQRNVGNYAIAQGGLKKTYNELTETLTALKLQYSEMDEAQRQSAEGQELYASIEQLTEKAGLIKTTMAEVNDAVANSAAGQQITRLTFELTALTGQFDRLSDEEKESARGKEMVQHMSELTQKIAQLKGEMDAVAADAAPQSIKKDLREMTNEIAQLTLEYEHMTAEEKASAAGQELKQKIQDLTEKAGELRDVMSDVKESISKSASDTRGFDTLAEAGKVTASVFGLCTSAAQALGISNQSLQASMLKLQQVMQAVQALTVLQTATQKQSNLMKGIAILQSKAAAAAAKIEAAATVSATGATKAQTIAQAAFNAVAKANPYVLLATAILAVIGLIVGYTAATKDATEADEEAAEKAMTLKDAREEMADTYAQNAGTLLAKYKMLQNGWNELKTDMEKTEFLKQHQKDFNDLAKEADYAQGNIGNVNTAEDFLNKATSSVTSAITRRAKAMAAYQEIIRLTQLELAELEKLSTVYYTPAKAGTELADLSPEESRAMSNTAGDYKIPGWSNPYLTEQGAQKVNQMRIQKAREENAKKAEEIQARYARMIRVAEQTLEENGGVSNAANFRGNGSGGGGRGRGNGRGSGGGRGNGNKPEEVKSAEDIEKMIDDVVLKGVKGRKDIIEEGTQEWADAVKDALNAQAEADIAAAEENGKKILQELEKTKAAKKISDADYNQQKQDLELATAQVVLNINDKLAQDLKKVDEDVVKHKEELADKEVEKIASAAAAEQVLRDKQYQQDVAALYNEYTEALKVAAQKGEDTTRVTELYNKKKEALDNKYANETVQAQIDAITKELEVENLSEEEREQLQRELTEVTTELAQQRAEQEKKSIEDTVKAEEDARKRRQESLQNWVQKAGEAIDKISGFVSALYDNQIAKIEELLEAEQEQYDKEVENIEYLAERGAITTEEAEIRKRDAAAATQKKQEELEKRKAALAYKKAITEKVNAVSQAAISTALAIMQVLAQFPGPAGWAMAAVTGAMGAVQIATILAQPIKAYKEGTKGRPHPGGLALVGEGGNQELVMYNGKAWVTPDKPTLLDLPKGAEVFPDVTKKDLLSMGASLPTAVPRDRATGQPIVINDYSALESRMAANTKAVTKELRTFRGDMARQLKRQKFNAYIASRI